MSSRTATSLGGGGASAAEATDPETGGGSLPIIDDPAVGATDDAEVLGTSVERPAAEAAAELNEGATARPGESAPQPTPRAEPTRRRGLPFMPRTGGDVAALAVTGGALVAVGVVVTRGARRRQGN